jgi:hypothetical protein
MLTQLVHFPYLHFPRFIFDFLNRTSCLCVLKPSTKT